MDASEHILSAPIGRLCWSLSLPAIAGVFLLGAATFADAAFVGLLAGTIQLGAILVAFPVCMIPSALAALFGGGAAAAMSRALGQDDPRELARIGGAFVACSLVASIPISALVIAFAPALLEMLGARGPILAAAIDYTRIFFVGAPFGVLVFGASFLIRGEGRIAASMLLLGGGSLLNVALGWWFVGVLGQGARGAGWATLATMVGTGIATLAYLLLGPSRLEPRRWRPTLARGLCAAILRDGSAPMLLYAMAMVQQAVVFQAAARAGNDDDVVFIGAVLRLTMLGAVPLWGMAMALQPVVGINHGAARHDRVRRAVHVFGAVATVLAMLVWAAATGYPTQALAMFIDDPELVAERVGVFRMLMAPFPSMGVQLVAMALLIGVGRGMQAALLLLLRNLVILAPALYVMPRFMGLAGVWLALVGADVTTALVALYYCWRVTKAPPTTP